MSAGSRRTGRRTGRSAARPGIDRSVTPACFSASPMTGPDAPRSSVRSRSKNAAPVGHADADRSAPRHETETPARGEGQRSASCEGLEGGSCLTSLEGTSGEEVLPLVSTTVRLGKQSVKQLLPIGTIMSQRWTSASSPPSLAVAEARQLLRRRPRAAHRAVERLDPRGPARAGARRRPSSTGPAASSPRRARRWCAGPAASRPSSTRSSADVAALRDEVTGTVRLGCIGTTARWLVPLVLEAVHARAPQGARDRRRRHHHLARAPAPRRRARPRRRQPPRHRPRASSTEPLFDEDRAARRARRPPAGRPRARHLRRPRRARAAARAAAAPPSATSSTARPPRPASSCGPRPRSTACGSSPRWPSRGSAPPSCRPPRRPPGWRGAGDACPSTGSPAARSAWPGARAGLLSAPGPRPARRGPRRGGRREGPSTEGVHPARRNRCAAPRGSQPPTWPSPSPSRPTTRGRSPPQITTVAGREVVLVRDHRRAPAGRAVRGRRPHLRRGGRARRSAPGCRCSA